MKSLLILLFSVITFSYSLGQSNNDIDVMLTESIKNHIAIKKKLVEKSVLNKDYLKNINFLKENFPSDYNISVNITGYKISYLEDSDLTKKQLKQGVNSFKLLPILLNGNQLEITITDIFITKKNSKVSISNNSSSIYKFTFNCSNQQWELQDIKEVGN